ncbi:permease-like cell division protein FtsX [Nocardioides pantholopis]|uniref:permease-like cell division protein FtsX n=1 Tax=Nocardioides pantholopis TaxID=2483798 RepID=UPI000F098946|nr:permease-like cell division protein FtsX [Nocardioides pantholopis]
MQLRYVFSELRQGLRRNLSMHLAVVLTLFVSLTLVGLGVLLNQQADRAAERYGNALQVVVYLCRDDDPEAACTSAVTDAQRELVQQTVDDNPEVESSRFESSAEAFDKVKELYGFPEDYFEGSDPVLTPEDMPEAIWITLKDPDEFEGITSAVAGLDGVSKVVDNREYVSQIYDTLDVLQTGALVVAAFLVLAALMLVANTIRLTAFARRKEIGIMRLVGASTLYITLPFLLEALVTALVSVVLAGGALVALMKFGVRDKLQESLQFLPWIGWSELTTAVLVVAVLGPLLTLIPTLLLTRKYLKV